MMIRYFIFTFFILFVLFGLFFYNSYTATISSIKTKQTNQIVYDYELAMQLSNEKLKNIHLEYFNDFTLSKTIHEINKNKNNNHIKAVINSMVSTKFHNNPLLKNIVFYNKNGEYLHSMEDFPSKYYDSYQHIEHSYKNDKVFFESQEGEAVYAKIHPIYFQGQIVGFIKLVISFENFISHFLPNYHNKLNIVENHFVSNSYKQFSLSILSKDEYPYFLVFDLSTEDIDDQFSKFLLRLALSFFLLIFLLYTLYSKLKIEKNLKEKIKGQKEFFRKIIETSPHPIFVKNEKSQYILSNEATAYIFGYSSKEDLLGKTNYQLNLPKKLCDILQANEKETLQSKTTFYKQIQKINDKYYKIILIPLYDLDYPTKKEMILGFATNITEEILKKNELANNNIQLKLDILEEIQNKIKLQKEKFQC